MSFDNTIPPLASAASDPRMESRLAQNEGTLRAALNGLDDPGKAEHLARQLETNFLGMMLAAMREAVPEGGLLGNGSETKLFRDLLDREYAQLAATQWHFDFHDALVRQILDGGGDRNRADVASPVQGAEDAPGDAPPRSD